MKKFLLASIGALFLATPAMADPVSDLIANVSTFTQADLKAADADAIAHKDAAASQCYEGALAYVQANPISLPAVTAPVGAVSAFQAGRDAVKFVEANKGTPEVPDAINKACGYLALDAQKDVAKGAITVFGFKL